MFGHYIHILFFIYLVSRYLLFDNGMPQASVAVRIGHALCLILLGSSCWNRTLLACWIVQQPGKWISYVRQHALVHFAALDISIGLIESVAGLVGLMLCYLVLRNNRHSPFFLSSLIPTLLVLDLYHAIVAGLEWFSRTGVLSFAVCIIPILKYGFIYWFYSRPQVKGVVFHPHLQSCVIDP